MKTSKIFWLAGSGGWLTMDSPSGGAAARAAAGRSAAAAEPAAGGAQARTWPGQPGAGECETEIRLWFLEKWFWMVCPHLKEMGLLHKVDLQLFLQLGHKLLKLFAPCVCSLLHKLLQLRGREAWEGGALKQLMHLLEARGQEGQLQRGGRGQLARVRVATSKLMVETCCWN